MASPSPNECGRGDSEADERVHQSPPWEADRPLTLEAARAVIGACFPTLDCQDLECLGSGWEFDAFLTADGWVFRFPRRAWCADLFERERRIHQLVSPVLPPSVAIPNVQVMGQPTLGFPYPTLASDIGEALEAIHSIPEEEARAAGVVEPNLEEEGRNEWLRRGLELASELRGLDISIDPAVSWAKQVAVPPPGYEGPLRFIHHDLSPEHLIVDPKTGRLAGILDWTDAALGDAARDFVTLVTWRGWDFTEEVLWAYRLPRDSGFRKRLRFMARLLSVIWLAEAHERGANVAKHIKWVRNAFATGTSS
jgi:aminoglycoside phosphotransferase (APT) family kinase protein